MTLEYFAELWISGAQSLGALGHPGAGVNGARHGHALQVLRPGVQRPPQPRRGNQARVAAPRRALENVDEALPRQDDEEKQVKAQDRGALGQSMSGQTSRPGDTENSEQVEQQWSSLATNSSRCELIQVKDFSDAFQ